jgi:glucose-6-phosphate 1-dehydrogenase
MSDKNSKIPTIFVVLGVTGDLTAKKIAPALFNLFEKKMLPPKFEFVGVSRRDWGDAELREHIRAILHVKAPHASEASIEKFLKLVTYGKIRFDEPGDYEVLNDKLRAIDDRWGVCTNKLFYLSVPPEFYDGIFDNLHASGLTDPCSPEEGWTRVVVEKPFGSDEKSAKELDAHLARLFKEEQIYRIDHYLAKEMLQNIFAFRFGNNLFEREWGAETIEAINIKLHESIGAEDRGSFYENVGALRDVGQNHLLQMLALVTMERPSGYTVEGGGSPQAISAARTKLLEQLIIPSVRDAAANSFRAQYDGYQKIKGVSPKSEIETYFRVRGFLSSERWEGVPIAMESGKRLGKPLKEIEIVFRAESGARDYPKFNNRIIIHLEPKEGITITFISKKPGHSLAVEERSLSFDFREGREDGTGVQYVREYEKLILDCIAGDQTLFVSSEEIRAMWRFTDPFIEAWRRGLVPLRHYAPDSAAIAAEAAVLMDQQQRQAVARRLSGSPSINRVIGVYGLGKMGAGLARNMRDHGWHVVVANRSLEPTAALVAEGFDGARTTEELLEKISTRAAGESRTAASRSPRAPRVVWLMITAGKSVDEFLFGKPGARAGNGAGGLAAQLRRGDIVIDGGNSFFEDSSRRAKLLARRGIKFLDVGVSGGPAGARNGACMMIGGDRAAFAALEELFAVTCVSGGYAYFGSAGAGHFVKMVHNGIEYGMMQSLAEGFALMKLSSKFGPFKLDLARVAHLYNHGSVIESRLVGWLESGLQKFGPELGGVSSSVAYTGEGEWTVRTGKKWKMKLPAIEDSFKFRVASGAASSKKSKRSPGDIYMGKILSALRNQFGGHSIEK